MSIPSITMQAGGTIEPSRFVAVNTSGIREVIVATGSLPIFGVSGDGSQVAPESGSATPHTTNGNPVQVRSVGSFCKIEAGAAVTCGDQLISDSVGRGIDATLTTGTEYIGGLALEAAAGAGEFIDIVVQPYSVVTS